MFYIEKISESMRLERDDEEMQRDHEILTDEGRARLADAINNALLATDRAEDALRDLRSDAVFDVEYAEGSRGRDMQEHARQALLHLRAMHARQADN